MLRKRIVLLFCIFLTLFSAVAIRLFLLSRSSGDYAQAAERHGSYSVKITKTRGTIYDANLKPIVNAAEEYYAAVAPLKNAASQLEALIPHVTDEQAVLSQMEKGKPFITKVNSADISVQGIDVVKIKIRYQNNAIAPHIVGYLNSDGDGISGIEKAYNSVLSQNGGTVTAGFAVDALGRMLEGVPCKISADGTRNVAGGVVLTLDKNIQTFSQTAAEKYLKSGAVVVMDAKNGDILASVSVPEFTQTNLAAGVASKDSAMLNRVFSAYNVGSTFKIAVTAAALESGISPSMTVNCTGKIDVSGRSFKCHKVTGHGVLDMCGGLSNSCNPYYITLGRMIGSNKIIEIAQRFGFGKTQELAPGIKPSAGMLPTEGKLESPAALANFSIGQGDLMATPVQIARMMCVAANGGYLPTPRLVKGIVNDKLKFVTENPSAQPKKILGSDIASEINEFLIKTVDVGTGTPAKPAYGGAGGKTATAETGWLKNGKIINQAWFAGFYPAVSPRYVIVVLAEAGAAGGASAGPVFKEIADNLAPYCGYPAPNTASSGKASSSSKTSSAVSSASSSPLSSSSGMASGSKTASNTSNISSATQSDPQ